MHVEFNALAINMFWMSIVLLVSFSAPLHATNACRSTHYRDNNGGCHQCPNNCEKCVSNTNCTQCQDKFWGLICYKKCNQQCTDRCHKEFGHCIYGCPNGTFNLPDSAECTNCIPNCEVCSSASDCLQCRPRFYGPHCQSCSYTCVDNICNMTTGECFVCNEGYFREDGNCQKCAGGCASCTAGGNCATCHKGFYGPFNGTCFMECRKRDQTSQFRASHDARCGIPNGLMSHKKKICENVSGDQSYTCSTNRYCLTNKKCLSHDSSSLNQDDNTRADVCLKVMLEECFTTCLPSQKDVINLCNQTCKVENVGDERYGPVCIHDNTPDSFDVIMVGYPLSTIDVLCNPGVDDTSESPVWRIMATAILFILVSGLLVLILIKMGCMYRITSRVSSSHDVVNGTGSLHPLEESRNVYQHALPHLAIWRDSMYDHAAPVDDASQSEVGMDAVDGTADSLYDHVLVADNARQWMIGVDSVEGTVDSLRKLSKPCPSEDRDSPDNDSFLADDREKSGS